MAGEGALVISLHGGSAAGTRSSEGRVTCTGLRLGSSGSSGTSL